MIYAEYEKEVFNWLNKKHNQDKTFTFSVRQKASKGAESDYFIGTQNSNYFGTTLWNIPVAYPGSSTDLINIVFKQVEEDKFQYYVQFVQTKSPHNEQNKYALLLIRNIKPIVKKSFGNFYENVEKHKTEYFNFSSKKMYTSINEMLDDLDKDINNLIPIIDTEIKKIKESNPYFIAERYTNERFEELIEKMYKRFKRQVGSSNTEIRKEKFLDEKLDLPLNQILYGPPGTGKTYHTVNKALEICGFNVDYKTRKEIKEEFDKRINEGQIQFITFHQSMSYEDFVEGIKPRTVNENVVYEIQDGIFKRISRLALNNILQRNKNISENNINITFNQLHSDFLKEIEAHKGKDDYIFKTIYNHDLKLIDIKGSSLIVMYKWQNIKKTIPATQPFSVTKEKLEQLFEAGINPSDIKSLKETFYPFFKHNLSVYYAVYKKFYDFVKNTAHIGKPDEIDIEFEPSLNDLLDEWRLIDNKTKEDLLLDANNFVIILDEINRGNVSQIFGELITLLEHNKRLGNIESLEINLPYSKSQFAVPPNVYVVGTMNTADRSVEALDTALRRRFNFEEMMPDYNLITTSNLFGYLFDKYEDVDWDDTNWKNAEKDFLELFKGEKQVDEEEYIDTLDSLKTSEEWNETINSQYIIKFNGICLNEILKTINERIEILLNRDHLIGHSYFMKIFNKEQLIETFYKSIIPLLQEYFYGDYGKIGLVLGNGFVNEKVYEHDKKIRFANFKYEDKDDLHKIVYNLTPKKNIDILKAIDGLLNPEQKQQSNA